MRKAVLLLAASFVALPLSADISYVYVRAGKSSQVSAANVDVSELGRITRRYSGTFVWVEREGEELVIRDEATLAEIAKAFEPLDELSPAFESLHDRMKPLEKEARELEERIDAIEDDLDDSDLTDRESESMEDTMRDLTRELRRIERRIRDLEREERRLERIQDEREEDAERELEAIVERAVARNRD